jgi:hypothetical protein
LEKKEKRMKRKTSVSVGLMLAAALLSMPFSAAPVQASFVDASSHLLYCNQLEAEALRELMHYLNSNRAADKFQSFFWKSLYTNTSTYGALGHLESANEAVGWSSAEGSNAHYYLSYAYYYRQLGFRTLDGVFKGFLPIDTVIQYSYHGDSYGQIASLWMGLALGNTPGGYLSALWQLYESNLSQASLADDLVAAFNTGKDPARIAAAHEKAQTAAAAAWNAHETAAGAYSAPGGGTTEGYNSQYYTYYAWYYREYASYYLGLLAAGHDYADSAIFYVYTGSYYGNLASYWLGLALHASSPSSWIKQWGTERYEGGESVVADGDGNVYVAGNTTGSIGEQVNQGSYDAFITKYNSLGSWQWTAPLGTSRSDYAYGLAVGGDGAMYVVGCTYGNLGENTNSGRGDVFLAKYDSSGVRQWTTLLGSAGNDAAYGVAEGSGGAVYVAGSTSGSLGGNPNAGGMDAFLAKYNSTGVRQWTKLLGSEGDEVAYSVAADRSGAVYVAGSTSGSLGGNPNAGGMDAFLAKYDSAGVRQWTRLLGSEGDAAAHGVAVDSSGAVYVAGFTSGSLGGSPDAGGDDAFLARFDSSGTLQWTALLGTPGEETASGVAIDPAGDVYVTGFTSAGLHDNPNMGGDDAFLAKYDSAGVRQWTTLIGRGGNEVACSVGSDGEGHAFVTGHTSGHLGSNSNAGDYDVFLVRYGPDGVNR